MGPGGSATEAPKIEQVTSGTLSPGRCGGRLGETETTTSTWESGDEFFGKHRRYILGIYQGLVGYMLQIELERYLAI